MSEIDDLKLYIKELEGKFFKYIDDGDSLIMEYMDRFKKNMNDHRKEQGQALDRYFENIDKEFNDQSLYNKQQRDDITQTIALHVDGMTISLMKEIELLNNKIIKLEESL